MSDILLIAPTCNKDDVGEAWVAYQWVSRLAERHKVTLLTYHKRGSRPVHEQLTNVEVIEWSEPRFLARAERFNSIVKPAYFLFYFRARRWIKGELARGRRFDLVHQPLPVAVRYPSPARGLGLPLLMGPVGGGLETPAAFSADQGAQPKFMILRKLDRIRRLWDPWLRSTYRRADCVLAVADYVSELLDDFPVRRLEIMSETGLDSIPPLLDRSHRRGPVRLLYVGRLVRTKGARDVIRALKHIKDLDFVFDVVGDGPERESCEQLTEELGLSDRIVFHGWRAKSEIAGFYERSDVFVFPSYREPGGNVTLEAMAHSLPLIVCNRGGPGSATSDCCAIRMDVTTPDELTKSLVQAIRLLVIDKELRLRMGRAAHAHVSATALWSQKLDRIDVVYRQLITPNAQQAA